LRYLSDLRYRLSTFEASFGDKPSAGITTHDLDEWLRALPLSPQSRINFRRVLSALFNFASVRGFARKIRSCGLRNQR
jgi:hypothetical protein